MNRCEAALDHHGRQIPEDAECNQRVCCKKRVIDILICFPPLPLGKAVAMFLCLLWTLVLTQGLRGWVLEGVVWLTAFLFLRKGHPQSSPTTWDLVCWMSKHRAGDEGRAMVLEYIMIPTRTIWPGGRGGHHKPVGLRQWPGEVRARWVDLMAAPSCGSGTANPSLWGWCVVPGPGEAEPFHSSFGRCLSRLPQSGCRVIFGRLSQQCTHVNDVWGVVSVGDLGARQFCKSAH